MVATLVPTLLVIAALLGAAAWAAQCATPPGPRRAAPPPLWLSLAPGLLGLLLTLPSTGIFQPGMGLGLGIALGSVAGTLAALALRRGAGESTAGMAVLASAVPLLALRGSVLDALSGVALGWLAALLTASLGARRPEPAFGTVALAGAILPCAVALGALRGGEPHYVWGLAPLALAAVPIFLWALGTRAGRPQGGAAALWLGLSLAGGALALFVALRQAAATWQPLAVGVGGAVLWALLRPVLGGGRERHRALLTGLLVLAGEMAAAHLVRGYGVGLFAVGMAVGALLLPAGPAGAAPLAIAALLTALRLGTARWSMTLGGMGLAEQYGLLGALLGALIPALSVGLARRESRTVVGLALLGLPALTLPLAAALLYGPGVAAACLIGLALGVAPGVVRTGDAPRVGALAAAVGVLLVQLGGRLDTWSDAGRKDRLRTALALVALPVVVAVGAEATRRRTRT